ncbi:4094_t:CDS:1, partial [Gigaspora rosea]
RRRRRNPRATPTAKDHHKQCHTNDEISPPGTTTTTAKSSLPTNDEIHHQQRRHQQRNPRALSTTQSHLKGYVNDNLPPAKSQPNCSNTNQTAQTTLAWKEE